MYNPRFGKWMTMDPKGQYFSPYIGMGNNPVLEIDRDGGESDWHPDGEGNIMSDQGDNVQTLAKYLGISISDAQDEINAQGLKTQYDPNNPLFRTVLPNQRFFVPSGNQATYGFGFQFGMAYGAGSYPHSAAAVNVGVFGTGGPIATLFVTVSHPDPVKKTIMLDLSVNAQLLFGKSNTSKFDLTGHSQTMSAGLGHVSASYNADNLFHPSQWIAGLGWSAGIEANGGSLNTKTVVAIPVYVPFLPF